MGAPNVSATFVSNLTSQLPEEGYQSIIDVAEYINKGYLWFILAFGIPGNAAAIFTIFRMHHLGSFGFYVVLLAVVDTLAFLVKIIYYQLSYRYVKFEPGGCEFINFLANYIITFANWILVLMAVGRLIAVKFPFKAKTIGYKASIISSVFVGFVLMLPYIPIFWITSFNEVDKRCYTDTSNIKLLIIISWTHRTLYSFLPFIILSVCNLLIARVIKHSLRIRYALREMSRQDISNPQDIIIQRQVMVMLFTTTLVFVVLTFPVCADSVGDIYWIPTQGTREDAVKYLLKQIAYVFCDSNHAINFYLYFFSARRFRSHCLPYSIFRKSSSRAML